MTESSVLLKEESMTVSKLPTDQIDGLLADYKKPGDLLGENGILKQLTKAVLERALEAEMEHYLGHARHGPVGKCDWRHPQPQNLER